VGKSGVCGSRIDELRKSKLLDASKSLDRRSLDQAPQKDVLGSLRRERDQVVNGIANSLIFFHQAVGKCPKISGTLARTVVEAFAGFIATVRSRAPFSSKP
jgi:hypothetical protein